MSEERRTFQHSPSVMVNVKLLDEDDDARRGRLRLLTGVGLQQRISSSFLHLSRICRVTVHTQQVGLQ